MAGLQMSTANGVPTNDPGILSTGLGLSDNEFSSYRPSSSYSSYSSYSDINSTNIVAIILIILLGYFIVKGLTLDPSPSVVASANTTSTANAVASTAAATVAASVPVVPASVADSKKQGFAANPTDDLRIIIESKNIINVYKNGQLVTSSAGVAQPHFLARPGDVLTFEEIRKSIDTYKNIQVIYRGGLFKIVFNTPTFTWVVPMA